MDVLVAGCGWLGRTIAVRLAARGDRVCAVRRSEVAEPELERAGVRRIAADLTSADVHARLPERFDAIVACQASGGGSEAGYRDAYVAVNRALAALAGRVGASRFVYTGSTGIFDVDDGSTVDERTPVSPSTPRSRILDEAERIVREVGCVVRLSGLYGPGRYGTVDRVRRGVLALGPGDRAWMNFCHRDDAATTVLAAIDRGRTGATYHGTDAHPVRRAEVVRHVAERLGIEPPVTDRPVVRAEGRKVDARRTREELGITLAFPSFREGFAAAFSAGG